MNAIIRNERTDASTGARSLAKDVNVRRGQIGDVDRNAAQEALKIPQDVEIVVSPWMPAPAPADRPLFAIGDVHGHAVLLQVLHSRIREIAAEARLEGGALVHLGDYVDRGPSSLQALQMALAGARIPGLEDHCLPGNHEQFLRQFLESSGLDRIDLLDIWLANGAYGIAQEVGMEHLMAADQPDSGSGRPASPLRAEIDPAQLFRDDQELFARTFAGAIRNRLGTDGVRRLTRLPNHVRLGQYLFVHGGLHPALGFAMLEKDWGEIPAGWASEDEDPLWIRGAFLTHQGEFEDGVIVVHGHTPRRDPELRHNRIGLDTGAYRDGTLTAVQIDGERLRFIQARDWNLYDGHPSKFFADAAEVVGLLASQQEWI